MEKNRKLVRIESDESGRIKAVSFDGKLLPVTSFTVEANASNPFAEASFTVHPTQVEMTVMVGEVALVCPICEEVSTHVCYDNPKDPDDYSQDPKY
jgi:hypothetical protein